LSTQVLAHDQFSMSAFCIFLVEGHKAQPLWQAS